MTDLRCAVWAREAGLDPIGTAGKARGWLLVDWPLPWPSDAGEVDALAPVREALHGTGIRLQLTVPDPEAPGRGVVLHRPVADDGWFAGYQRVARRVDPAEVVAAAVDLVRTGEGDLEPGRDVLLCGHGSRDRCCGSMGTSLAIGALAMGIAVRRTSHTGGHRFAPTGILLPEGTFWAFLDEDALDRVVHRRGDLDDLLPRYRGNAGMPSPAAQAVERIGFEATGWSWLDHRRRCLDLGGGRWRLESIGPDGAERSWEAEVGPGRRMPVPDCGKPVEDAPKFESELVARVLTG